MDVDDPPITSDDEGNLQAPPTLTNVISIFLTGIFKSVLNVLSMMVGFSFENLNNIVLGRNIVDILG